VHRDLKKCTSVAKKKPTRRKTEYRIEFSWSRLENNKRGGATRGAHETDSIYNNKINQEH
jgi:hypothetical protein